MVADFSGLECLTVALTVEILVVFAWLVLPFAVVVGEFALLYVVLVVRDGLVEFRESKGDCDRSSLDELLVISLRLLSTGELPGEATLVTMILDILVPQLSGVFTGEELFSFLNATELVTVKAFSCCWFWLLLATVLASLELVFGPLACSMELVVGAGGSGLSVLPVDDDSEAFLVLVSLDE